MSGVYDNWERLVEAVLKREDFKRLALCESFDSSNYSSRFSFSSSHEDVSVSGADEEKSIQGGRSLPFHEALSYPILLADRAIKAVQEAEIFKPEMAELARQVSQFSHLLRSSARFTTASAAVYDRPIHRVSENIARTLERALTLIRKCRRNSILSQVLTIIRVADFKEVSALLDSSLADIKWVLSIFNQESDDYSINLSLPPIASDDPILAWIWSYIAGVHMGRAEAAHELAVLAGDSDRNKKIIVEEEGVPPLLKMLKERGNLGAQIAAASALYNLADDQERVGAIVDSFGVEVVARELSQAPVRVQITLVNLVSRMSETDAYVQGLFGRENVTRSLVSLLGVDVDLEEFKNVNSRKATNSLHSLAMINKEMMESKHQRKERETKLPEMKLMLKISCANALWKLAKGHLPNSSMITETKALLVLAKIIEKEERELKMNCLMVLMELAAVAESNTDLKRAVFRPNMTAPRVVLDQLLRVINEDTSAAFVSTAIKAIGCLASTFPAKEKRIVQSLVTKLDHENSNVATEAANALVKFVCEYNYNCKEHSQAIVEFNGLQKLRPPLDMPKLVLLCNLAINAVNIKAFKQTHVLSLLEKAAPDAVNQNPDSRELFAKAIHHLTIYWAGVHTHGERYGM